MRIAVQPHDFELGGSQLNAVELAGAVRDRGHEVFVVCGEGPIAGMAAGLGLPLLEMPAGARRPSPVVVRALRGWVRRHGLEVVHGYEWPPVVEAWAASVVSGAVPVGTIYSMEVASFLPRHVDLVVGTHQIAARAAAHGLGPLHVVEPPVDTAANHPDCGGAELRRRLGVADDQVLICVVGRLAPELKLEGILSAIECVGDIGRTAGRPAPALLIVGDGSARAQVDAAAAVVNGALPDAPAKVVGQMPDPRSAYDAADICLGMGGSALRSLAFGKPLIVQGERGFWKTLTPDSHPTFAWAGWYGVGEGGSGAAALAAELEPLLDDRARRAELGAYGLALVSDRYSLDAAADRLVALYAAALRRRSRRVGQAPRVIGGMGAHKVRRRAARRRGGGVTDDYNQVELLTPLPPPAGWTPPVAARAGS